MSEKGFGFKNFIVIIGVIFFALLITVVLYKVNFKKNDVTEPIEPGEENKESYNSYEDLEYKLKLAGQRYQNDNYQGSLDSEETWVLSYKMLRKEEYLKEKLMDIEDSTIECDGYVLFEKDNANIKYTPYLKCGSNYETKGYNPNR